MHNRWNGFIAQTLLILLLGHLVSNVSRAGQKSQDRETQTQGGPPLSLQRKVRCLQAQIQKWQEEGKDLQPIGEIMQDFDPLMGQQKFAEAERLVDRALMLLGRLAATETRPPAGDVSLIAYGAQDSDGRQQIFVVKPDGTEKRRLTQ